MKTEKTSLGWLGRAALFISVTAVGTLADLWTKALARDALQDLPGRMMVVFKPWLDLELAYNRGTSFSMISNLGTARTVFGIFSLVMAGVLLVWVLKTRSGKLDTVALATIAAGAIGNGWDRLFRPAPGGGTGVIDFIRINYPWGGSWPNFNVADILVLVGAAGYVVIHFLSSKEPVAKAGI